jgi:hypothetical protein
MLKSRSFSKRSQLRNLFLQLASAGAVLLLLAITASAYTLVFRDGRRLEIPSEFTVTRTTVTFEMAPGFNKTLQVALLDVPATERANGEAPGSFFKHQEQQAATVEPSTPPAPRTRSTAAKTLSNSDLEAVRQRRIESEQAYEKRRQQLGLPTLAETRRRQAEDAASLQEYLREKARNNARDEAYWRGRARELRTEIASVDAGINYLRARLNESRESSSANQSIVTGVYPLWPYGRGRYGRGRTAPWGGFPQNGYPNGPNGYPNGTYGYPNGTYGYPNGTYGYPNGTYGYPNGPFGFPNGTYGYPNGPYGYPNGTYGYPNGGYGYPTLGYPQSPFGNFDNSAEQMDIKGRLDDMIVKRAALAAQWQALEDEARDARIPQVWLLP